VKGPGPRPISALAGLRPGAAGNPTPTFVRDRHVLGPALVAFDESRYRTWPCRRTRTRSQKVIKFETEGRRCKGMAPALEEDPTALSERSGPFDNEGVRHLGDIISFRPSTPHTRLGRFPYETGVPVSARAVVTARVAISGGEGHLRGPAHRPETYGQGWGRGLTLPCQRPSTQSTTQYA
jgi:hypothetical protein